MITDPNFHNYGESGGEEKEFFMDVNDSVLPPPWLWVVGEGLSTEEEEDSHAY